MNNQTPQTNELAADNDNGVPGWIAFSLVTSSYFVVLFGVVTYCLVLP